MLQRIKAVFRNLYKIKGGGIQMKNWPVHLEFSAFYKADEYNGFVQSK